MKTRSLVASVWFNLADVLLRWDNLLCSYVRLELLEGVVAYHSGRSEAARQSLTSAQQKFQQVITSMPLTRRDVDSVKR